MKGTDRRTFLAQAAAALGAGAVAACTPKVIQTLPGAPGALLSGAYPQYMQYGTLKNPHIKLRDLLKTKKPVHEGGIPVYEAQAKFTSNGRPVVIYALHTKNDKGGDIVLAFRSSGVVLPTKGVGIYDGHTDDFDGTPDGWLEKEVTNWKNMTEGRIAYHHATKDSKAQLVSMYQNMTGNLMRANELGQLR